jgi:hypothetical protein
MMGRASSSQQIYTAVNNRQEEHQSTVVESSGTLNHINVKILFDSGATDSFISPSALEKRKIVGWYPTSTMTLNKSRWLRGKNKR